MIDVICNGGLPACGAYGQLGAENLGLQQTKGKDAVSASAYKCSVVKLVGPLLVLLFSGSGLSQDRQRSPRPLVQPVNLVSDSQIEGMSVPVQETHIRSSDGLCIPAVVLSPGGSYTTLPFS